MTEPEFELTEVESYSDEEAEARGFRDLAVVESTPIAAHPARTFTRDQLDLIKSTVANGTSDDEFRLFIEVCKLTGLNPFAKQIYAIMRSAGKDAQGHWVKRMTIQTGIDGYRLMAARTGELAGIDDPTYDTEDGEHPNRATVTVYRLVAGQRMPFVATARWREYAALDKDGAPTNLWAKMPWLMLGKCSEALALRKAFAAELSGVYTAEEMAQADNPDAGLHNYRAEKPASAPERAQAPQNARSTAAPTPASARPASAPSTAEPDERVAAALRNRTVLGLLSDLGVIEQSERRAKVAESFAALDRRPGVGAGNATVKQLMEGLEAALAKKRATDAANGYDLQATGAFAGPLPN